MQFTRAERLPYVLTAYIPSGKASLRGLLLCPPATLLASVAVGAALFGVHAVVSRFAPGSTEGRRGLEWLVALLAPAFLKVLLAGVAGYVLSNAVGAMAVRLHIRSRGLVTGNTVFGGLVAFATYVALGRLSLGKEALDSFIYLQPLLFYAIPLVGIAFLTRESLDGYSYCEDCKAYLVKAQSLMWVPFGDHPRLMELLGQQDYGALHSLPVSQDRKNKIDVTLAVCEACGDKALLEAHATWTEHVTDTEGGNSEQSEKRRVYSAMIRRDQIRSLLPDRYAR